MIQISVSRKEDTWPVGVIVSGNLICEEFRSCCLLNVYEEDGHWVEVWRPLPDEPDNFN